MDSHREIWDFDSFETEDLERLVEMETELEEMGLSDVFSDAMMAEVHAELSEREDVDEQHDDDQHTITHT